MASFDTGLANAIQASAARCIAVAAERVFAIATAVNAAIANNCITANALACFIGICRVPAVSASRSLPLVDHHVGTVRVVVGKHLLNDLEEVKQTALLKCELDCWLGIAFTQPIVLDMRMRDSIV